MKYISDKWPLVYAENLFVNDKLANIAIVTYWSNIDFVKNKISNLRKINVIGNAYSKLLCLNPILVNLSANRYIRYLILCGDDKENAEQTFDKFFNGDLIDSMEEFKDAINIVKNQVKIIKTNFDKLNNFIESISPLQPYDFNVVEINEILKPKSSVVWNSLDSGYILRSDNMVELFSQVNQRMMTRGKLSEIRGTVIREINNLITVYNGPILDDLDSIFLVSSSRIKDYYNEFENRKLPEDQTYTYSTRIFIEAVVQELKNDNFTKRAYSPIFYPDDYQLKSNPCAVGVHYLIVDNKLHSTIFFRSNDMFRAWPLNMLGFRYQQKIIADILKLGLGPTTIVSSSAQIYSENWSDANEIIKKYGYRKNKYFDPEGYFICSKEIDDTLLVNYFSIDGKIQWMWQTPTSKYEQLIEEISTYLTDTQHSAYVAKELTKLAHNIYTENSANKMLTETPMCTADSCSIKT